MKFHQKKKCFCLTWMLKHISIRCILYIYIYDVHTVHVKISLELQLLSSGASGHNDDGKCSKCGGISIQSALSFVRYFIKFSFNSFGKWKGLRTTVLCLLPIHLVVFRWIIHVIYSHKFSQLEYVQYCHLQKTIEGHSNY